MFWKLPENLKPEYSGSNLSDIWWGYHDDRLYFSVQDEEPGNRDGDSRYYEDYFIATEGKWFNDPVGGSAAEQMTWAQVWDAMPLAWHAYHARAQQHDSNSRQSVLNHWYYSVFDEIGANEKDRRLTSLCEAISARDVVVFTIAFNISQENSALLKSCATTPNHYYNVTGSQISYAFSSIAGTINQLQLVE